MLIGLQFVSKLSKTQEFLLSQSLLGKNEAWCYHTQFSYHLRVKNLSLPFLIKALKTVLNRHPIFKTVIFVSDSNGLTQGINMELDLQINYENISSLLPLEQDDWVKDFLLKDRNTPFEINNKHKPLFRSTIINRGEENIQFVFSCHHSIWDGWSFAVLLKEVLSYYQQLKSSPTLSLKPARYDYQDFLANEKHIINTAENKHFWLEHLKNHQDFWPKPNNSYVTYNSYEPVHRILPSATFERLIVLQQNTRVSLKSIFLGSLVKVVHSETNQAYCTIGVVTNGRTLALQHPLQTLGLLWNIAPLCVRYDVNEKELLQNINKSLAQLSIYGAYPLLQIIDDIQKDKLFHVAFNFINFDGLKLLEDDSDVEFLTLEGLDKFHLPLHVLVAKNPFNSEVSITMNYDTRYYAKEEIEEKMDLFFSLLENS